MDGILIVNKPKKYTSHDIVYKVKKILNEKVGHTGTLDPMATGVLPLLIGKGTKCSKYLVNHDKIYQATIQLGKKTDTADLEGKIIEEKEVTDKMLQINFVTEVLKKFIGKQKQTPPIYSAIKINGKKLYEYARQGKDVQIPERTIEIYDIELIAIEKDMKQITFKVSCSKGTYIRTLGEDIAKNLGTVGHLIELNRLKVGDFSIEDSIKLEEIEEKKEKIPIITIEQLFEKNEMIKLDINQLKLFLNGVNINNKKQDGVYRIYFENKFIGIGIIKKHLLKRDIII